MELLFVGISFVVMVAVTVIFIVKETRERNEEQADFNERLRAHSPIEGKL